MVQRVPLRSWNTSPNPSGRRTTRYAEGAVAMAVNSLPSPRIPDRWCLASHSIQVAVRRSLVVGRPAHADVRHSLTMRQIPGVGFRESVASKAVILQLIANPTLAFHKLV